MTVSKGLLLILTTALGVFLVLRPLWVGGKV